MLPTTEKDAIAFLQAKDVLPSKMYCGKNHEMKLYFGSAIFWKCNKSSCRKEVNIRHENSFANCRLSFVTAVRFICLWSKELISININKEQLGISKNSTVE